MKAKQIIFSAVMILTLAATPAFAVPENQAPGNEMIQENREHCTKHREEFEKDPIKALKKKKKFIKKLLKEGKITKEKADEKLKRIDEMINVIKEFQKMPLQQKKEMLIKDCEQKLLRMMKDGKLEQKDAEMLFRDYVDKINKWDGNGYPFFHVKNFK